MEEMEITQFSVLIGHWYLQHTGPDWRGHYVMQYRTYLISASYDLLDAGAFARNASFSTQKQTATGKEKQEPHQHVRDTAEVEEIDNVDEQKEEVPDTGSTVSAMVFSWKISTSADPNE